MVPKPIEKTIKARPLFIIISYALITTIIITQKANIFFSLGLKIYIENIVHLVLKYKC